MTLIKCEECGKEISDKAATCPHCGAPTVKSEEKSKRNEGVIIFAAVILISGSLIALASYEPFCSSEASFGAKAYTDELGRGMYFRNKYLGIWNCPRN